MDELGGIVPRIYGNMARLIGGKATAGVISLIYMLIAARTLGPQDYGALVLIHAYAMTVGGIVEVQGWHAVVRYGASALAENDRPRLTRLLSFAALVELAAGALAVAVAAALAPLLGPRLGWSQAALDLAAPYSLAVLASIRGTPGGYLQLIGRFDLLGWHMVVAPMVRLVGGILAVLAGWGLTGFLIAWLVAALAEWAVMWVLGLLMARGRLAPVRLKDLRRVPTENPGLGRFMAAAKVDFTLSELGGRLTPLAVGWMLGPVSAAFYAVAQRATAVLTQPALILGQAAYAELARLVAAGEGGSRLRAVLLRAIGTAVAVVAPICLVLAVFGPELAVLMAGDGFAAAGEIILWLAIARTILMAGPPMTAALTALGRPDLSIAANLLAGPALLVILPVMLDHFGLRGAGVHAVGQALLGFGLLLAFVLRETREADRRRDARA